MIGRRSVVSGLAGALAGPRVGVLHNSTDPVFLRWGEETEGEIRAQGLAAMRLGLTSTSVEAMRQTLRGARSREVGAVVVVRDFLARPCSMSGPLRRSSIQQTDGPRCCAS